MESVAPKRAPWCQFDVNDFDVNNCILLAFRVIQFWFFLNAVLLSNDCVKNIYLNFIEIVFNPCEAELHKINVNL